VTTIVSLSSELPPHRVTPDDVERHLGPVFTDAHRRRLRNALERHPFESRFSVEPLVSLVRLRTLGERHELYREHACALGVSVARRALECASRRARDVTHLLAVSSTGQIFPSLATELARRLDLAPGASALPIANLGCAGGVAALGLAADLARGGGEVLVVCVDLPWLHLPLVEPSIVEVLATTQLGDGAAAAVVSARGDGGIELLAGDSCRLPGDVAANARLSETGLRLVSAGLATGDVHDALTSATGALLERAGRLRAELGFWVLQPGSRELLETFADVFELDDAAREPSWRVLHLAGNTIAASALFVLGELAREQRQAGSCGLMIAPGTGRTCELRLLRWHDAPRM